ncbi:hypothetical protein GCM10022262_16610 [Georgenia daeguensis]|uniref:Uncharacterized protein n=1 Tax=Georgenia daeguensis TaxID=908355 RepID=A0ABP8ETU2_9MICO
MSRGCAQQVLSEGCGALAKYYGPELHGPHHSPTCGARHPRRPVSHIVENGSAPWTGGDHGAPDTQRRPISDAQDPGVRPGGGQSRPCHVRTQASLPSASESTHHDGA